MHLDSLSSGTRNLLEELAQHIPEISDYLLVGGTALALNIAHRISEDLDFAWPGKKLDRDQVDRIIRALSARGHVPVYSNPREDIDDAIEHGLELDDYCQNWLVDDVKLTFFAFGDYDVDRDLIRKGLEAPAKIGFVNVADSDTIFDAKCIALTDRIKSRDIFDLWWLIHNLRDLAEVFERISDTIVSPYIWLRIDL
jgi:predicted nucleotidyltransferase component of viral defense system